MMHAPTSSTPAPHDAPTSNGGRLVSTTGRALPLLGSALRADAAGGVARVTLEQRFHNPYAEPLAVTYSLPLPADGAVSGFAFRIGDRRVVGEIDRKRAARERFEQAIMEGRSAALLEQDRSSLFTQEIGNIPPGEEVIVEVSVDQRLRWLDEGAWEWRFPTVVAPRYLGEAGRVPDAAKVMQDVADGPVGTRFTIACAIRDALAEGRRPESPSHAIDVVDAGGARRVALRDPLGAKLDRDVVVRWMVTTPKVGLALDAGRAPSTRAPAKHVHGLLTIVPPSIEARHGAVPRDLIVLLDTSGSMHGAPLEQAVRVTIALVETLRDQDRLELIEFSSAPRRWKPSPVSATASARREAIAWLRSLSASGGTEMRSGILEALASLRAGAQRQVVLITDGLIGFESQVVAAICDRLPMSSRLHTVGVGSGVNRSLTGPAARAGHGIEVVIGLGEDPERAASRLVAHTTEPLLVDLTISGSALVEHAPARLPDLFANAPALIGVALDPHGGDLVVRGRTAQGTWEQRLRVGPLDAGSGNQAAVALFGREAVEDLELRLAAGGDAREIDAAIERIGIDYQIATRLTSWVAVSQEITVDPGDPLRRERMPHELPYGMSAEGLGLRPAAPGAIGAPMPPPPGAIAAPASIALPPFAERSRMAPRPAKPSIDLKARLGRAAAPPPPPPAGAPPAPPPQASLTDDEDVPLAAPLESPSLAREESGALPSEAAPQRRSRGFFDAIKDFFTGGEKESEAGAPEPAKKKAERAAPRWLRGRVALARGGELVIEVTIDGEPLDWAPRAVTVVLRDGRTLDAIVDARRTTRAGQLSVGQSARLALTLAEAVEAGTILRVVLDSGAVNIAVA
jgi:Ca-activated chloride channel family protein